MNAKNFINILRFEVKVAVRQPALWLLLVLFIGFMIAGTLNGKRHKHKQDAAIARIQQQEMRAVEDHKAAAQRYAQPADSQLPYWQDPTDVAGYMRYGLVAFAVKPSLPLGALAVGQSDVLPFYVRAQLDFIAPPSASFEFENPRALSLGEFDLSFVLVYLLPLLIISLTYSRLALERDTGILRFMAAQPCSPQRIIAAKFGAIAGIVLPVILLAMVGCLVLANPYSLLHGLAAYPVIASLLLVITGYTVFWFALCAAIASRHGAVASASWLVGLWIVFCYLIPAGGAFLLDLLHPAPSRLHYLNDLRHHSTETDKERNAIVKSYLADPAQAAYAPALKRMKDISYATKQIAVQGELERRMQPHTDAFERHHAKTLKTANWLRLLSPALIVDTTLQRIAGTDSDRHHDFLRHAHHYTLVLRQFFWPRALEQAARPTPKPCLACPARMNFTNYDAIPRFYMTYPAIAPTAHTGWLIGLLWMYAVSVLFAIRKIRAFFLH